MIDSSTPGSPGWWLARLTQRLAEVSPKYDLLWSYYDGSHLVPARADKAVRASYRRLMDLAGTNFAELIVDAVLDRMTVTGFRTGAEGDELSDAAAWGIWQANGLDHESDLILAPQLAMGASYAIVGEPNDETNGEPLITAEDPRQMVVEFDPQLRRKVIAALKLFRDDVAGVDFAYLYLPGRIYTFKREIGIGPVLDTQPMPIDMTGWSDLATVQELPALLANKVPVAAFLNRPDLWHRTKAEIEGHLGLLNRIDYTILTRLEIATMQAFRQRAVKGDLPLLDEAGHEINYDDVFAADPGALWQLPSTVELWESGQVDLGPIRSAVRDDVQDLAAVTRTPLYYLTPDDSESAEGAGLKREGLVFKTGRRLRQASDPFESLMSLAFLFKGDQQRAARPDMEVLWASPDHVSLSERMSAAVQAKAADVPWRTRMTDILGYSPQEVARMEAEQAVEELAAASLAAGASVEDQQVETLANIAQSIYLAVPKIMSADEARDMLNRAGAGLTGPAPEPAELP